MSSRHFQQVYTWSVSTKKNAKKKMAEGIANHKSCSVKNTLHGRVLDYNLIDRLNTTIIS